MAAGIRRTLCLFSSLGFAETDLAKLTPNNEGGCNPFFQLFSRSTFVGPSKDLLTRWRTRVAQRLQWLDTKRSAENPPPSRVRVGEHLAFIPGVNTMARDGEYEADPKHHRQPTARSVRIARGAGRCRGRSMFIHIKREIAHTVRDTSSSKTLMAWTRREGE